MFSSCFLNFNLIQNWIANAVCDIIILLFPIVLPSIRDKIILAAEIAI